MKIKTVILDDDVNSQKAAVVALKVYDEIEVVGKMTTSLELFDFLRNYSVDLLFLDIELKDEFGFLVAEKIKQHYPSILMVFFTGHASYAIDGYDFQPVSFLTKPINQAKLDKTIDNVKAILGKNMQRKKSVQLMFKCIKGYQLIKVQDICYVEHRNRKNFIITIHGEQRIANYTVKELEKMLEPYGFYCCHQSFLVPIDKIISINQKERQLYVLTLENTNIEIPISRNKYEDLREIIKNRTLEEQN